VKNDKNVNNKCKYIKENYEFKYYPKVSPTKKTVLNTVNKFVPFLDYVSNLFFQKCELSFLSQFSFDSLKAQKNFPKFILGIIHILCSIV
jgi:hypothetical protein